MFRENKFEHSLTYQKDGQRIEVAFIHLPGTEPTLKAAAFQEGQEEPIVDIPPLNMEEIRMRYRYYSWLHESGLLD